MPAGFLSEPTARQLEATLAHHWDRGDVEASKDVLRYMRDRSIYDNIRLKAALTILEQYAKQVEEAPIDSGPTEIQVTDFRAKPKDEA
jgi:hypothetical protein